MIFFIFPLKSHIGASACSILYFELSNTPEGLNRWIPSVSIFPSSSSTSPHTSGSLLSFVDLPITSIPHTSLHCRWWRKEEGNCVSCWCHAREELNRLVLSALSSSKSDILIFGNIIRARGWCRNRMEALCLYRHSAISLMVQFMHWVDKKTGSATSFCDCTAHSVGADWSGCYSGTERDSREWGGKVGHPAARLVTLRHFAERAWQPSVTHGFMFWLISPSGLLFFSTVTVFVFSAAVFVKRQ